MEKQSKKELLTVVERQGDQDSVVQSRLGNVSASTRHTNQISN